MAKLPWAPPKAMDKDKVLRPLSNSHSVLRRTRITRVTAEEEQWRLPLQRVNMGTLSLEWVRRRLNKALRRFDAKWRYALRSPEPHSSNYEPKLRIDEADAKEMERSGVSFEASREATEGFVVPFMVVGEKPAGPRSRFVAWPRGKNDHGDCEAEAPQQRVSCYLDAVFDKVAGIFNLKASFFSASSPQGSRAGFRCRTETGRLAELTRLQSGKNVQPRNAARGYAGVGT
ncbi:hypothetical protein ERJ75_000363800 [Trypanosoma vivax]|nr:hypothetical protein ERJ75_000363800 [Trypanosoma vivax]